MFYKNSYLEKMAEILQKRDVDTIVKQLTDENEIFNIFRSDMDYIIEKYREGAITYDEAKRNFEMLKAYVLTQLKYHFEKVKELAEHFGVTYENEELNDELVEKIVEMLDKGEKSLN